MSARQSACPVAPVIADLRERVEAARRLLLERALRQLAHLPEQDRLRIEAFSAALVDRVLDEPAARLGAESGTAQEAEHDAAMRYLFGLVS